MKLLINAITLLIVCLSAFPSAKVIAKNANGQNTEMINKVIKSRNTELMTQKKRVASDNAKIQNADKNIATRVIEGGTKIIMHFGNVVIPATLNDSKAAKALIARLPLRVDVSRYTFDFCGVMEKPLPYTEEEIHYGWLNGDIDFAPDGAWFTILFDNEEKSEELDSQVNLGKIDCNLSEIAGLRGSYNVLIELAK